MREDEIGMYNKDLQVKSTERKGWFLYSTLALDKTLLAEKYMTRLELQFN